MKSISFIAVVALFVICLSVGAQEIRKELPTNHASADLLRPLLKKVLSPQGRFVVFPTKGTVLIIDTADKVSAAELALARMESPVPDVLLDFAFNPGNKVPRKSRLLNAPESYGDFPFPTAYLAPRIVANGKGGYIVTPAHPTGFTRRKVGNILETQATANPDGSVTIDINASDTEFAGFINYGSAVFGSGAQGIIPIAGQIVDPRFFGPVINTGPILMPVFDTTRISTQIIVRPSVSNNIITVDMIPQLKILTSVEPGVAGKVISLKRYRTSLLIQNGKIGAVNGFKGASPEFNRRFLGGKEGSEGHTSIKIRARVQPGKKVVEEGSTVGAKQ